MQSPWVNMFIREQNKPTAFSLYFANQHLALSLQARVYWQRCTGVSPRFLIHDFAFVARRSQRWAGVSSVYLGVLEVW